jgi:hypothetical protein
MDPVMDAAAVSRRKPGASDLLLEHCLALELGATGESDSRGPTAVLRLEALLGVEMARRLLLALAGKR